MSDWAVFDDAQRFSLFELIRKARETNSSIHDCILSRCTIDPNGVAILVGGLPNPLANPSIRPPLDATILTNIQKLRGMGVQI